MKIEFPKITRDFSCAEYAPEVEGSFTVWVNPPTRLLSELSEAFKTYTAGDGQEGKESFFALLSELLSQTENKYTPAELMEIQESDTDPMFWPWLQGRVLKEINEHRFALKKV